MLRWLDDRGLRLAGTLDKAGDGCRIIGEWTDRMVSAAEFAELKGPRIRVLSNGDYTDGVILVGDDGHRTIAHIGPNEPRKVYDHRESDHLRGADWQEKEELATL